MSFEIIISHKLAQINQILAVSEAGSDTSELNTLKSDLEQLIKLSEESLLEIKKEKLLNQVDFMFYQSEPGVKESEETKSDIVKEISDLVGKLIGS